MSKESNNPNEESFGVEIEIARIKNTAKEWEIKALDAREENENLRMRLDSAIANSRAICCENERLKERCEQLHTVLTICLNYIDCLKNEN